MASLALAMWIRGVGGTMRKYIQPHLMYFCPTLFPSLELCQGCRGTRYAACVKPACGYGGPGSDPAVNKNRHSLWGDPIASASLAVGVCAPAEKNTFGLCGHNARRDTQQSSFGSPPLALPVETSSRLPSPPHQHQSRPALSVAQVCLSPHDTLFHVPLTRDGTFAFEVVPEPSAYSAPLPQQYRLPLTLSAQLW